MVDRKPVTAERERATKFLENCLEAARVRLGVKSRAELARRMGISPNALSVYLSTQQPTVPVLIKAAELAGLDITKWPPAVEQADPPIE